jgi:L-lactate dehydrogenase complex protein LldG
VTIGESNRARERILARVRKAQNRTHRFSRAEEQAVSDYLRAHPRGPLPPVEGDLIARFRAKADAMQSTSDEVAAESEVPHAVVKYLQANRLQLRGCVWPQLAHLDWKGAGLDLAPRGAIAADPLGVTGAFAALAETGTLMLVSGPDTPGTVSLLPETHVAIVAASSIVAHMEEAWDRARRAFGRLPRAVNFVSGPSRTGDIEQKMVLGVHGPYRVHIVLVRGV